jgi:hypothetical protein
LKEKIRGVVRGLVGWAMNVVCGDGGEAWWERGGEGERQLRVARDTPAPGLCLGLVTPASRHMLRQRRVSARPSEKQRQTLLYAVL